MYWYADVFCILFVNIDSTSGCLNSSNGFVDMWESYLAGGWPIARYTHRTIQPRTFLDTWMCKRVPKSRSQCLKKKLRLQKAQIILSAWKKLRLRPFSVPEKTKTSEGSDHSQCLKKTKASEGSDHSQCLKKLRLQKAQTILSAWKKLRLQKAQTILSAWKN
jgi:hypothetical protein